MHFIFLSSAQLSPNPSIPSMDAAHFLPALMTITSLSWFTEKRREQTRRSMEEKAQRLEEDARTDELTGLGNRKSFKTAAAWLTEQARRDGHPFALAFIDVDRFKDVNDAYGHETGDAVLRHVAQTLMAEVRASDRVFRWGGDEFIILMPNTNAAVAEHTMERVQTALAGTPFTHGGMRITCTVSIGVCHCHGGDDIENALTIADGNMYAAKAARRGRL
jgi:two-component system cell cycle response regulator